MEYILLLYCAHLYDEYTYLIRDGCRYHRIMIIIYDRIDINVNNLKRPSKFDVYKITQVENHESSFCHAPFENKNSFLAETR